MFAHEHIKPRQSHLTVVTPVVQLHFIFAASFQSERVLSPAAAEQVFHFCSFKSVNLTTNSAANRNQNHFDLCESGKLTKVQRTIVYKPFAEYQPNTTYCVITLYSPSEKK